ncbi:MAG: thioredoxin [Defluviitaleaceae bacterium]|nr:thioredoxin [Defluviitaleaceae bacterium]
MSDFFRASICTRPRRAVQIFLLTAGVVLIALGVFRGELAEIFAKGSIVCMECIGLG